jgi:carboxymethylenebutenolidase
VRAEEVELGHLVVPEGGPHRGVVLIHDVWGVSDHTRDLARRLAGDGFAVLAIDLYRRAPPRKIENPGAFMRALSDPEVLADVRAAVAFLADHPACAGHGVGVTGFCMGGMYALLAACEAGGAGACVAWYGLLSHEHGILHDPDGLDPARKPRQPLDAVRELARPLLCFFGDADEFVPQEDVERLRERLTRGAVPAEVEVFPGCGHAFANDTRPEAFRPEATRVAWARMLAFLRAHLA